MCSTDFGVLDLLFDKEDPSCKGVDGFRNTFFSTSCSLGSQEIDVKEEILDSGTIDWKMAGEEWDADELLRSVLDGPDLSVPQLDPLPPLPPPVLDPPDDMDSLEDLVGLPFHAVMDSAASDSGMSSDSSLDPQMSPGSGYSVSSPESLMGAGSPDSGQDAVSDVSCASDLACTSPLASLPALPTSPDALLAADDFILPDSGFSSPVRQVVSEPLSVAAPAPAPAPAPAKTLVTKMATTGASPATSAPLVRTVTVGGCGTPVQAGQTIVVTQANGGAPASGQVVRGPAILKSGQASRSILLPVTVKDLNQVRTIKIISTGGGSGGLSGGGVGGRGVRTVVSTVRTPTTPTTTAHHHPSNIRTALLTTVRPHDSKSVLKGGSSTLLTTTAARPAAVTTTTATTTTTTNNLHHRTPTRIKLEPHDYDDEDDDDDDQPQGGFQQLTLSDEEKRLLKKEGILLPTHYPLTKQEERELKRIRRKIRNKISAQDSRKRKKEYIDGLEDRVKACTEENQQLQKRIRSLEAQNESLLVQMKRFQTAVANGSSGRLQTHASTALMMLILSAALFIVPAVRQDSAPSDKDLSLPAAKMPSAGHSRSLLEAGNVGLIPDTLDVLENLDDEVAMEVEVPLVEALGDHDYTPSAKRQRTALKSSPYFVPPLDDFPPQHGKPDSGGGFPPDDGSVAKLPTRIMESMVDQVTNNYSDPGGKHNEAQAVVVNLGQGRKRLRDDLELE